VTTDAPQRRRDRLRAETLAEIRAIAFRQVRQEGVGSISLRGIAREIGMTPGALYSYYDTRDALVDAMIADVYTALAERMERARESRPATDPAGRVLAVAKVYRDWAIADPEEFRLVYGDAVPGYRSSDSRPAAEAEHRACAVFRDLVAESWPSASSRQPPIGWRWADLTSDFAREARAVHPELPPEAIALALRIWGRMHGLVALEVYGHLVPQVRSPAKLFRTEMLDLCQGLGLSGPAD
jgi:AcrR family transcriptional regulator